MTQDIETKNYDGSYCPKCTGKNVEITEQEFDFGYLFLRIECHDCGIEYTSTIRTNGNKLSQNEVKIVEGSDNAKWSKEN